MIISTKIRIEKAVSDDKTRPAISEPFFDVNKGKPVIVATNGKILAVVPVEADEGDASGYVSADTLAAARKATPKSHDTYISLADPKKATLMNSEVKLREGNAANHTFPNWKLYTKEPEKPLVRIGINADLLHKLSQAIGSTQLELIIEDAHKPIFVRAHIPSRYDSSNAVCTCPGAYGVIMPVAVA